VALLNQWRGRSTDRWCE